MISRKTRRRLIEAARYAIIFPITIVFCFPIFWMISTSFKPRAEWMSWPPVWIPSKPILDSYISVLFPEWGAGTAWGGTIMEVQTSALQAFRDGLIISGFATFISVLAGTLAAYSVSRFRTGGKNFPFSILTIRMMPPIAVAFPVLVMYMTLKLTDTHAGVILAYAALTIPYSFWLMKSFIDEIPVDLENAALLLGAGRVKVLRTIIFPLITAAVAVTALFVFILCWTEYLLALMLTYSNVVTVTMQLDRYYAARYGQLFGPQAALSTLATIPVIVFGLVIRRHLVRGLTFGAIKR